MKAGGTPIRTVGTRCGVPSQRRVPSTASAGRSTAHRRPDRSTAGSNRGIATPDRTPPPPLLDAHHAECQAGLASAAPWGAVVVGLRSRRVGSARVPAAPIRRPLRPSTSRLQQVPKRRLLDDQAALSPASRPTSRSTRQGTRLRARRASALLRPWVTAGRSHPLGARRRRRRPARPASTIAARSPCWSTVPLPGSPCPPDGHHSFHEADTSGPDPSTPADDAVAARARTHGRGAPAPASTTAAPG